MHRFKWEWDSITTFNQFVASFVHPFRQKMSEVLYNLGLVMPHADEAQGAQLQEISPCFSRLQLFG